MRNRNRIFPFIHIDLILSIIEIITVVNFTGDNLAEALISTFWNALKLESNFVTRGPLVGSASMLVTMAVNTLAILSMESSTELEDSTHRTAFTILDPGRQGSDKVGSR